MAPACPWVPTCRAGSRYQCFSGSAAPIPGRRTHPGNGAGSLPHPVPGSRTSPGPWYIPIPARNGLPQWRCTSRSAGRIFLPWKGRQSASYAPGAAPRRSGRATAPACGSIRCPGSPGQAGRRSRSRSIPAILPRRLSRYWYPSGTAYVRSASRPASGTAGTGSGSAGQSPARSFCRFHTDNSHASGIPRSSRHPPARWHAGSFSRRTPGRPPGAPFPG